jgi:hypothetical protein
VPVALPAIAQKRELDGAAQRKRAVAPIPPNPITQRHKTIQRMYNGPEDDFLHDMTPPTGTFSPRITQITGSVIEGGQDFFKKVQVGTNRLSRRMGFEGPQEQTLVIADHKRCISLVKRVVTQPRVEYFSVKSVLFDYYKECDQEQIPQHVVDEYASHEIPKVVGTFGAGAITIGALAAFPTSLILNRYFGKFEDTMMGRVRKLATKTAIKRFAVVPVVMAPLFPIEIFGAIETNLRDAETIKQLHPRLYKSLRDSDYDLMASTILPLVEAVDRERAKRTQKTTATIEEI